jgi:TrmH family RNA methyltransferase
VTLIDSPHNPRLRVALELRERSARDATGLTLVDGAREARRALEAGVRVETAFVCPGLLRSANALAALALLRTRGAATIEVSERAFEKLAFGDRADGLVLVVHAPPTTLDVVHLAGPGDPLVLVSEDVEKPGNLGAIIRTADAAGCDAVIAIGGTDLFNPNVVRASIGTAFSMPLAAADAPTTLAWLRDQGLRVVAARPDAARPYADADLRGPLAIVLGSEALGLSQAWQGSDIEAVSIPMLGVADSLNVAATAAILAYEARRQRGTRAAATAGGGAR